MNPFEPRPAPEPESPRAPVAQPPMMPSSAESSGPPSTELSTAEPTSAELSTAEAEREPASPRVEEPHAGEVAEPAEESEEEPTSELPTMAQLDALSAELDDIDAVLAHMDGPAEQQPAN